MRQSADRQGSLQIPRTACRGFFNRLYNYPAPLKLILQPRPIFSFAVILLARAFRDAYFLVILRLAPGIATYTARYSFPAKS